MMSARSDLLSKVGQRRSQQSCYRRQVRSGQVGFGSSSASFGKQESATAWTSTAQARGQGHLLPRAWMRASCHTSPSRSALSLLLCYTRPAMVENGLLAVPACGALLVSDCVRSRLHGRAPVVPCLALHAGTCGHQWCPVLSRGHNWCPVVPGDDSHHCERMPTMLRPSRITHMHGELGFTCIMRACCWFRRERRNRATQRTHQAQN